MPDAQFDLVENYDTAPQSDWFHACCEAKKPYVVVRTGEKNADVMWDYVTLPPSCDDILIANKQLLKEQVIAIFQKHASLESSVRAKPTIVFFDNLTITNAKSAANELYALIESLVENPALRADANQKPPATLSAFPTPVPEENSQEANKQVSPQSAAQQHGARFNGFELSATV